MSKKDSYYFPHFYNARHDRKIKRIRKDLGIEGYGIFFMLLEVLREQTDLKYPMADVDLLADEFGTSVAKIEAVLRSYDLFTIDAENMFFSTKLMVFLQPYIEKSERARRANEIRWSKYKQLEQNGEKSIHLDSDLDSICYTDQNPSKVSKVKYKRVKNIKVSKVSPEKFYNDNFSPITPFIAEQIKEYIENDGIEEEMIVSVMEMSLINNAKSWNYVKSVLEDKLSNGIKTLEQFETYEKYRRKEKNTQQDGLYREVD